MYHRGFFSIDTAGSSVEVNWKDKQSKEDLSLLCPIIETGQFQSPAEQWIVDCHHGFGHGAFLVAVESIAREGETMSILEVTLRIALSITCSVVFLFCTDYRSLNAQRPYVLPYYSTTITPEANLFVRALPIFSAMVGCGCAFISRYAPSRKKIVVHNQGPP